MAFRLMNSLSKVLCLLLVLRTGFVWCYHGEGTENEEHRDLSIRVKVGVLGLLPKENISPLHKKCDKVLYEQVAMRLALDHISAENKSIIDLSNMLPAHIHIDPIYTSNEPQHIVGNTTVWAKNNIVSCAQHEMMYDIGTSEAVMIHDDETTLPDTVDMLLGPRVAVNYECQMMRQIAALGRIPMITWGCTNEELGQLADYQYSGMDTLPSTTISMLPENTESLQAHAIMDFLHDHNWDKGHVAVLYEQDDGKSLQLIEDLNGITSCNMSHHKATVHGYSLPLDEPFELDEMMERIKAGDYNIILSGLKFIDMPSVLYKAYKLGMTGRDNIWIYTNDFTPSQLNVSSTPVEDFLLPDTVEEKDKNLLLGELLHGSFSIGWTPGGADYSTVSNPWHNFKKVWSEQRISDYPDLGLPEGFFDYPPLSANAALVYDSAFIGLVTYFHNMINSEGFYDTRLSGSPSHHAGTNHSGHGNHGGDGDHSFHFQDDYIKQDYSTNEHDHHGDEEVTAHMHVCASSDTIQGGLEFNGVSGRVYIGKKTKARRPVANIISAVNLQWSQPQISLEPYKYGAWPYTWNPSWTGECDIPTKSLWTKIRLTPLKYGSSETPPKYRSNYSQAISQNNKQKSMILAIGILVASLGILSAGIIFLLYRYRRAHKQIVQNERSGSDFQFEWETNAGKALAMLSTLIDTMGEQKDGGQKKEAFEKKLAQIRRFLLAQDARVEMNQVKSSIARVGAERYTPEVTAYLMAHALNVSQVSQDSEITDVREAWPADKNSFERSMTIDKTDMQNLIEKTITNSEEKLHPKIEGRALNNSLSFIGSGESLAAISPVVDSVLIEQTRNKLIHSLNKAASGCTSFNVFELATLSGDRPLSTLTLFLLHRRGVCSALNLNMDKLIAFLVEVENMMFEHPYHNKRHVADVVAGIHAFTVPGGCLHHHVVKSPLSMLAVLFAASVHDLQHPGVNNAFLSKTLHPLAVRYSDKSVNENHHLACAFDLLGQEEFNFMKDHDLEDFYTFRSLVIDMVLATDMKSHFSILDSFKRFQKAKKEDPKSVSVNTEISNVLAIAIKAADLIHCARPLEVHHKWVDYITEEFFIQGDLEKDKEMKISPGMDRSIPSGALQQVGFTEIFVLPLFKALRDYSTKFGSEEGKVESIYYNGVEKNYQYWLLASQYKTSKD